MKAHCSTVLEWLAFFLSRVANGGFRSAFSFRPPNWLRPPNVVHHLHKKDIGEQSRFVALVASFPAGAFDKRMGPWYYLEGREPAVKKLSWRSPIVTTPCSRPSKTTLPPSPARTCFEMGGPVTRCSKVRLIQIPVGNVGILQKAASVKPDSRPQTCKRQNVENLFGESDDAANHQPSHCESNHCFRDFRMVFVVPR